MQSTRTQDVVPTRAAERCQAVRAYTEYLCGTPAIEDHVLQPMPDASPSIWQFAHTAWFLEETAPRLSAVQ
jgi:hypothetical protein